MGRNIRLLVIDDNPDLKDLYETAGPYVGAEIKVISDGLLSLPFLEKNEVDAVLVDLAMPYFDGFSCVKEIRENEKLQFHRKAVRLAFFTAHSADEVVKDVQMEFNVERVFHKPISPEELVEKVKEWLKH